MKLKHLLTLGVLALCSATAWSANPITVDGSPMLLKYSDADTKGSLFVVTGSGNDSSGELTYSLDVQKPGDYLLYFTTGNKNLGLHAFHVFVNDDETGIACGPYAECGGNWSTAIVVPVEVTLPGGEVTLRIKNDEGSTRWYFVNNDVRSPYLILKDDILQVGENEVSLDHIHTAVGSTQNYTNIHWNGAIIGDYNKSLISGTGNTNKDNPYSAFPKTKLIYKVNAGKTGKYPVSVTGIFRNQSGVLDRPDYTLNVKVNDNTVAITNFSKSDDYSSAKGMLHLEEGVNVIELSTDFNTSTTTRDNILFFLSDFTFSPALDDDLPFISGDNTNGYVGHEFTITGLITNAPEDPYSIHVYLDKDDEEIDLGKATVNENNDGFELVISEDLSKQYFSETGSYNLTAKMFEGDGNDPVTVSDQFVLTLDYQTFMFTLTSAQRGSLKATFGESNSATASNNTNYLRNIPEGEEVEFTVTPNEGYFAKTISVTDSEGITVDYTMTRNDDLNQWNSWNIFYFSENFDDFITRNEDGDICTFKLTATQPYTVSVSYEQHVRLIEVDLDACSPKDNVKVINNNSDNWNDNSYRQYTDAELGYNIFWRNMPYGVGKDIYFIQPEGTTISRLLVNNEEVDYDIRDFKTDVTNGVHYYVDMKQNYRLHAIFAYNEFPITVNQTEDENNGKIENGSIAFEQLTKLTTPDTEEGEGEEGEETEEPVAVDEDTNLFVPENGTLTLTGVENGVKSLRIHVTPEEGYIVENVTINGKDFTEAIEDTENGGYIDYLVNSNNLDVNVSFRLPYTVVTVAAVDWTPTPWVNNKKNEGFTDLGVSFSVEIEGDEISDEDFVVTITPNFDTVLKPTECPDYMEAFFWNEMEALEDQGVDAFYTEFTSEDVKVNVENSQISVKFPCSGEYTISIDKAEGSNIVLMNGEEAAEGPIELGTVTVYPTTSNIYDPVRMPDSEYNYGTAFNISGAYVENDILTFYSDEEYNADFYVPGLYFEDIYWKWGDVPSNVPTEINSKRRSDINLNDYTKYDFSDPNSKPQWDTVEGTQNTLHVIVVKNGVASPIEDDADHEYFLVAQASEPTGIDYIDSEDAEGESVYYTLQGVKVNNPEKGIFIKIQNGKASKVIFK